MQTHEAHRAALLGSTTIPVAVTTPKIITSSDKSKEVWRHTQALTVAAFERLEGNLTRFGNRLSEKHREALMRIVGSFTMLATGTWEGRYAFDLPCGGGKTQAVVAWCAELWNRKLPYSVLVCQTQVAHLCDLKRQLIDNGVPEDEIGLVHTLTPTKDILPATKDNDKKQIVLVTHQKIRKGRDIAEVNTYQGRPRSLVVWDESLLVSEHRAIEKVSFEQGLGYVRPLVDNSRGSEDLGEAISYLESAWTIIQKEYDRQKAGVGRKAKPIRLTLPEASPEDLERYIEALPKHTAVEAVRHLLAISQAPLRVILSNQGGGGCIKYDIAVPPVLTSVAVLDASWAIRDLERLDKTIQDDPGFDGNVKDYEDVTVHFLHHASGRASMTKAFMRKREDRKLSLEIATVVKCIPEDQGVLIFTFKQQETKKAPNMADILRGDLKDQGIDVDATLPCGRPRLSWLTWGQETSTSNYQHCLNVIFAGVLHRADVDLGGAIAGQKDDLTADISQAEITKVKRSEIAHSLLQAINRGACRQTVNGKAKTTNVWLIHHDPKVKPLLETAMPNLGWEAWETVAIRKNEGRIEALAKTITRTLSTIGPFDTTVSTRKLKGLVGVEGVPRMTWTNALKQALEGSLEWELQGRSVVRV